MKLPTIDDAKELARRYHLAGAIIISFPPDARHIGFTGYGADKLRCKAIAEVSRQIEREIRRGTIEIPPRLHIPLEKGISGDEHDPHDNG